MAEADDEPAPIKQLARFARRLAGSAASTITTLASLALIIFVAYWSYTNFLHVPKVTYGRLLVDSPEIYTRERLVNDRFVEDAWLRRKLRDTDKVDFGPTGSVSQYQAISSQILDGSIVENSGEAAPPDNGGTISSDALPRPAAASFRSELDFRREVRNLIIENQLDDRHDLRGNSLYRLKFDASVLPGENTRANALISVTLQEPERKPLAEDDLFFSRLDPAELAKWRQLYEGWLSSISENISQSLNELKDQYRNGRFTLEYYRDIIEIMDNISIECNLDLEGDLRKINLLTEGDEPDLSSVKQQVENVRQRIKEWSCVAPVGREGSPTPGQSAPAQAGEAQLVLDQLKGAETRAGTEPGVSRASQQAAGGPPVDSSATGRFKPTLKEKRQAPLFKERQGAELLPRGESKRGMSRNSLLNRLAGPKLSQLALGSGQTDRPAAGRVERWDIFLPFATVLARYEANPPFEVSAHEATLQMRLATKKCTLDELPVIWHRPPGLCLNKTFGRAKVTLDKLGIDLAQLTETLQDDPKNRERIESLHATDNDETATLQIKIEAGLFAFIRELQKSRSVFSYAVTPKQSVQTLEVDESMTQRSSATGGWRGIAASFSGERGTAFKGTRDQPLVVGFGDALDEFSGTDPESCGSSAETSDTEEVAGDADEVSCPVRIKFGWFISPPVQGTDGQGLNKVHAAAQYALTALVSVPAWWDEINLKIEKAWLDDEGGIPVNGEGPNLNPNTEIDLPSDLESITLLLLDRGAGPEIEENRMEPIAVTACRPASMLLPGRRLWRSAVVTLGSQVADEIQVLPNMRGIIAKFDQVQVPTGWPHIEQTETVRDAGYAPHDKDTGDVPGDKDAGDAPHRAPVTVWTSEGSSTLRRRAAIHVPGDSMASWALDNGTCRPLDGSAG